LIGRAAHQPDAHHPLQQIGTGQPVRQLQALGNQGVPQGLFILGFFTH